MGKKQDYYRTTSLLRAQPRVTSRRASGLIARWWRRILPTRVPWTLVILAVLAIGITLWMWQDTRWYVTTSRFKIVGASEWTTARVIDASKVLGMHSLWVRADEIAVSIVEQVSAVTEAKVDCWYYPAACNIQVKERQPVLAWISDGGGQEPSISIPAGTTYWVDENGYIFPAPGEEYLQTPSRQPWSAQQLPTLRGPLPSEERISLDIFMGLQSLEVLGIPSEEVIYHPRSGLVWVDPRGTHIAFGVGADMEVRWHILQALLANLEARGIFPMTVDVRFPSAPTYSLEKSW